MTTYLFWILLIALSLGILLGLGLRFGQWKAGGFIAAVVFIAGTLWYVFWLEQVLVKRFGGVMHITAEEGSRHIGSTWKDDNLWIETWHPADNTCVMREYSRSGLLQGKVVIEGCNPVAR